MEHWSSISPSLVTITRGFPAAAKIEHAPSTITANTSFLFMDSPFILNSETDYCGSFGGPGQGVFASDCCCFANIGIQDESLSKPQMDLMCIVATGACSQNVNNLTQNVVYLWRKDSDNLVF
jgi:hypothetical protein